MQHPLSRLRLYACAAKRSAWATPLTIFFKILEPADSSKTDVGLDPTHPEACWLRITTRLKDNPSPKRLRVTMIPVLIDWFA
jgi:hypothetical protein